ncbi:hypothetical protein CAS74_003404 [Pichia kudriavzevii]|uniref:Pre-mRNA-splicing factor SPF27 n=1 Tax=Pichia kudriavzevii TaxID=4909 RepID=A0A1Z8JL29_PICKU|nr:hypothetical protein CAS74_003404 [Pichia kudriavzevii]
MNHTDYEREIQLAVAAAVETMDTDRLHPQVQETCRHNDKLLPLSEKGLDMSPLSEKYTGGSQGDVNLLFVITENPLLVDKHRYLQRRELESIYEELEKRASARKGELTVLENDRKQQLGEFAPINNFLTNRWNEKLNEKIQQEIAKIK